MFRSGRYIGVFTGFLNRILSLALALFVLVLILRPEFFTSSGEGNPDGFSLESLAQYKLTAAIAAVVLLVLNLNIIQFLIYSLWNSNVRRYITSTSAGGTSRVSLDAIERTLKESARALPEVTKCKLRAYRIAPKRYKVEVLFWIPGDCNVLNISEKLRLILKKRFTELVSVEPDERVYFEVSLAGIKGKMPRGPYGPGSAPKDGIDGSKRQFKGPVYPLGGDL